MAPREIWFVSQLLFYQVDVDKATFDPSTVAHPAPNGIQNFDMRPQRNFAATSEQRTWQLTAAAVKMHELVGSPSVWRHAFQLKIQLPADRTWPKYLRSMDTSCIYQFGSSSTFANLLFQQQNCECESAAKWTHVFWTNEQKQFWKSLEGMEWLRLVKMLLNSKM